MLVNALFANNVVKWTSKHERDNNEDKHTPSLNASIEKEKVKAHDIHSVDIPWHCDTLHANVKHMHSLDYDMQENKRNIDKLCRASVIYV